jgi:hypothetical protein
MPGHLPGIPGYIAFAGVKFCGYCLAGVALKKLQPAITASAVKIAGARTGLGILLGPPLMLLGAYTLAHLFPESTSDLPIYGLYVFLFFVRVLVWAFLIFVFTKRAAITRSTLWTYSLGAGIWSCLLDLPGFGLAFISPGQIPFC